MRVKPKQGLLVRDPHTRQPLPPEGAEVPETAHWRRRLLAGDVVLLGLSPVAHEVDP